ncbi:MAG: 50S ribosomal protein L9 [Alphaproteobacteria bacterium]|jgi:large subunit ribosomal protein L9|nr:50S ribosomal protein L9 [Alphaproteobacteria bacterium]
MEVILLERIEKLGQMGDVVSVKSGYARNYLLPQKKALRKTKDNVSFFESQKAQLEADNLSRKGEAEQVAAKIAGLTVPIIRAAGESGQLYGSVTARDIAEAVTASGMTVSRQQIVLDRALKTLGLEPIRVSLHPEVDVTITVNIARSNDEAEQQLSLGRAVGTGDEMDDDEDEGEELQAAAEALFVAPSEEAPATEDADDAEETTAS